MVCENYRHGFIPAIARWGLSTIQTHRLRRPRNSGVASDESGGGHPQRIPRSGFAIRAVNLTPGI